MEDNINRNIQVIPTFSGSSIDKKISYTLVNLSSNENITHFIKGVRTPSVISDIELQNPGLNSFDATTYNKVSKRFVKPTQDHIFAMKERRVEVKTVTNTTWSVKIFKDWLYL